MTLEQMRALADNLDAEDGPVYMGAGAAALRAAADQLEAVQAVLDRAEAENAPHLYPDDFTAILTADTAPQEASALDAKLDALGLRDPDEPARPDSLPFPHAKADKMLAPQEGSDECEVVTESSAGPLVCTKLRGHDGAHNTEGTL